MSWPPHRSGISCGQKPRFYGRDRGTQCWRRCGDAVRSCEWHLSGPPTSSASCTINVMLKSRCEVCEAAGAVREARLGEAEPKRRNTTISVQLQRHRCSEVRKISTLASSASLDAAAVSHLLAVALPTTACRYRLRGDTERVLTRLFVRSHAQRVSDRCCGRAIHLQQA